MQGGIVRIVGTLALFLASFVALRHAAPGGIILYQGVLLGLGFTVLQLLYERFRHVSLTDASKHAAITFLLIYSFVFTVPTTADRAYSVAMLTRLGEAPDGLSRDELTEMFVRRFLAEGGVDKRLVEQTATGSIEEHQGRYALTSTGRLLDGAFRITQILFACGKS